MPVEKKKPSSEELRALLKATEDHSVGIYAAPNSMDIERVASKKIQKNDAKNIT